MTTLGRIVFAIAMIGFGVTALIYGDFTHNLQPVDLIVPRTMPGYVPLATPLSATATVAVVGAHVRGHRDGRHRVDPCGPRIGQTRP